MRKLFISLLFVLLVFDVYPQTLSTNLISYWNFETGPTTTLDNFDSHNGTVSGALWNTPGTRPPLNMCYYFDGMNDYINFGAITLDNKVVSISLWAKLSDLSEYYVAFGRYYSSIAIYSYAGTWWISCADYYLNSLISTTTNWTHIVLTYDGNLSTNNLKIYVNGSLARSTSVTNDLLYNTHPFHAGDDGYGNYQFHGYLDEIGIWSKELTSSEVTQLYNSGQMLPWPFPGGSYTSLGYRHYIDGIEWIHVMGNDTISNYINNIQQPESLIDPNIIFAEDFENVTAIDDSQLRLWNVSTGGWDQTDIYLSTAAGHGNVMKIDFDLGDPAGTPMANSKLMIDSIYPDIYFQYDQYLSPAFDYGDGGKMFGSFAIGESADMPYRADTALTGSYSMIMFEPGGYLGWYNYTHNAVTPGYPLSATVQLPGPTHPHVGVLGQDYSWGYSTYWYAWPSRIDWNGSVYDWASEGWLGRIYSSQWNRITMRVRLGNGGKHDIFAIWVNGICTYSQSTNRYRTISNINWGVEGGYLNGFFGGGTPTPANQSWLIDNLIIYNLPSGNIDYSATAPEISSTITTLNPTQKYLTSPATPKSETYPDASGTIYSHNRAFHYMPNYMTVTKTIKVNAATTYSVTMTQFGWYNAGYGDPWIKIYRYNSGSPTLVRTYDLNNHTLGTDNMTCDSVKIVYYNGEKPYWRTGGAWGFTATYTSNGTGSGNNPVYGSPSEMVAIKP